MGLRPVPPLRLRPSPPQTAELVLENSGSLNREMEEAFAEEAFADVKELVGGFVGVIVR